MKIKKKDLYKVIVVVILVIFAIFFYFNIFKSDKVGTKNITQASNKTDKIAWLVDTNGYLYYPLGRGEIKFTRENYSETENLTISKLIYQSRRGNIYGLLVLPKYITEQMPGIVLLPGAGVSKESELLLAEKISELGAAVLIIDQRGTGETDGDFPSLDDDYNSFLNSMEPVQHLMVYDALRGYDLLNSAPFIDKDRIILAGESLGARIAVIATAIDRNIDGVLVISSSGFDFQGGNDPDKNAFLKSIDMDHYIDLVAPRKIVMIHAINDSIVPISSAARTFSKAQEPKQFALINDTSCKHGYCDAMYTSLVDALDYLVEIRSRTLFEIEVPLNK